jgi:hypothetical protein
MMATFDLKSGYHHVDIHPAYTQYLGLCWDGNFYKYLVCPFGMAVSGLVFSKILRELVRRWRSKGITMVLYIDDGIVIAKNVQDLDAATSQVRNDLLNSGFIVNAEKTHWPASTCVHWLGFQLDSEKNIFIVPEEKMARLKAAIAMNMKHCNACSARELSRTVGKLCSLFHVFGSVVYIMTKNCTHWIADRVSWSNRNALPDTVKDELSFWLRNLETVIRQPLEQLRPEYTHIVYSDASATGCGAYVVGDPDSSMVHSWTADEKLKSSTWRETQSIFLFLQIHADKFKDGQIKVYTDNQGVPSVIHKGSMRHDLNVCAAYILQVCIKNNIRLSLAWVPRDDNIEADALSKFLDPDDWAVQPHIFELLNNRHGKFTVDVFASNVTSQIPRFYSKFWCKGTLGVDAFAYNWGMENCWLVPPPKLVPMTLKHMKACKAHGVMVVPRWQTSSYWPLIHNGEQWNPGISLLLEYNHPKQLFKPSPVGNQIFSEKSFQSNVIILGIDYR